MMINVFLFQDSYVFGYAILCAWKTTLNWFNFKHQTSLKAVFKEIEQESSQNVKSMKTTFGRKTRLSNYFLAGKTKFFLTIWVQILTRLIITRGKEFVHSKDFHLKISKEEMNCTSLGMGSFISLSRSLSHSLTQSMYMRLICAL